MSSVHDKPTDVFVIGYYSTRQDGFHGTQEVFLSEQEATARLTELFEAGTIKTRDHVSVWRLTESDWQSIGIRMPEPLRLGTA